MKIELLIYAVAGAVILLTSFYRLWSNYKFLAVALPTQASLVTQPERHAERFGRTRETAYYFGYDYTVNGHHYRGIARSLEKPVSRTITIYYNRLAPTQSKIVLPNMTRSWVRMGISIGCCMILLWRAKKLLSVRAAPST